jgi:hypothetical protein
MSIIDTTTLQSVLEEVANERLRQDEKWGQQDHPWVEDDEGDLFDLYFNHWNSVDHIQQWVDWCGREGDSTYAQILLEEFAEAVVETDPARARAELVQVAAVAVAAIESIDRNGR